LCKETDTKLVFTYRHATFVERFNRTIKEMIHKYLQSTGTKTITNVLPKMLKNYNNSYHSSIGMAPNQVTKDTMHIAQINIINRSNKPSESSLKVGDRVRVEIKSKSFRKGYKPKFTKDIFEILEKKKGFYLTDRDDRLYQRANLQKVESFEINPEKPDLENTREGHLRNMRTKPTKKYEIEEEPIEEKQQNRRLRERKPVNLVENTRYGRVQW
jgi:stress-induced morphogen